MPEPLDGTVVAEINLLLGHTDLIGKRAAKFWPDSVSDPWSGSVVAWAGVDECGPGG